MARTTVPVNSPSMHAALPSPTYFVLQRHCTVQLSGNRMLMVYMSTLPIEVVHYLAAILCPKEAYRIIIRTRSPVQGVYCC